MFFFSTIFVSFISRVSDISEQIQARQAIFSHPVDEVVVDDSDDIDDDEFEARRRRKSRLQLKQVVMNDEEAEDQPVAGLQNLRSIAKAKSRSRAVPTGSGGGSGGRGFRRTASWLA